LDWCQFVGSSYDLTIFDFSTSWQNGLAFCAIAHYYQPDLIDFDALDPEDKIGNLDKAFQIFKTFGIATSLNPEEIARKPDEQTIRTYLLGLHSVLIRKPRHGRGREHRRKKSVSIYHSDDEPLDGLFSPETVVHNIKPDVTYKVIMLGDSAVGKSALFERWRSNLYQQTSTTVGMELWSKVYCCDSKYIQVQLWDTAGQELYRAVTKSYYREAMGALLVFDLTKMDTFQHISSWWKDFQAVNNIEHLPILLIGNKSDLEEERMVSKQEATDFATTNGFLFFETSARQGNDCQHAFQLLFQEIYKIQNHNEPTEPIETADIEKFDPQPRSGFECSPCSN